MNFIPIYLDLGLAEGLHHELVVSAQEGGHLLGLSRSIRLTLLLAALLLEFLERTPCKTYFTGLLNIYQLPEIHDGGGRLVNIPQLLIREAEHLECLVGELKVFVVINALDLSLALRHIKVEIIDFDKYIT